MKLKNLNFGLFFLALTFAVFEVSAFSVGSSYYSGNPFTAYPGQNTVVNLDLQNSAEDTRVKVTLLEGSEVASLDSEEYFLPSGTESMKVPVSIDIPSEAEIGKIYSIVLSFEPLTVGESGGVVVGTAYDVSFDVLVVEKPVVDSNGKNNYLVLVLIIAVILIAIYLIFRKKYQSLISKKIIDSSK